MPAVILNKGQQVFMTTASSDSSTTSNAEMQYSDQATQVDFPIAATFPRHRKRMMQRYNTTIDGFPGAGGGLIAQNGGCIKLGHSTARQSPYHRQDRQYQHQNQPRPKSLVLSNASGGTTPDASSLHSVDSNPSQRGAPSVYSSDIALSTSERSKKWNTPIAAYNFGKVWKSSSTGGLKSSGYDSSTMSLGGGRGGGCGCQCNCNNLPMRSGKMNMAPFSNGIGVPGGDTTPGGLPGAEGLSWRRLHMSRAKLKATATTSELLSGFAMVAMVELQINEPTQVPEWLFVMFSVCTTVLVAVHIFALMISTYLLPNIDAISKLEVASLVSESPHERMRGFIELAWAFSTVFGLFLFLVEVAILCWVKFWDYSFVAAMAATVIVIPVLIIFVAFAVHFYHSLVIHKCEVSHVDMQQLEDMKKKLDKVASPV